MKKIPKKTAGAISCAIGATVWPKPSWPQEKRLRRAAYRVPSAVTALARVMSPTQADPTGAEAMATGDSSSMATPSSDERGRQGLPAVPGSRDGRVGLEVVSAAGGGGPLLHGQAHHYYLRCLAQDMAMIYISTDVIR